MNVVHDKAADLVNLCAARRNWPTTVQLARMLSMPVDAARDIVRALVTDGRVYKLDGLVMPGRPKTAKCVWCGASYVRGRHNQTACTPRCGDKHHARLRTERRRQQAAAAAGVEYAPGPKTCACGAPVLPPATKHCSRECRLAACVERRLDEGRAKRAEQRRKREAARPPCRCGKPLPAGRFLHCSKPCVRAASLEARRRVKKDEVRQ